MASIKDLKKRIGTVKNTQQTTRAMKMVSAAKLRRAQDAIHSQRPYAKRLGELIALMSSLATEPVESPLLKRERELEDGEKKKVVLVLVTSDRGLCGPFNSSIIKTAQKWVKDNGAQYQAVEFMFLGRKGFEFYRTKKVALIGTHFQELAGKVTFANAKKLSDALIEVYVTGRADEVKFVFNEFVNAVTQRPVVLDFLPIKAKESDSSGQEGASGGTPVDQAMYIVRPSHAVVLQELIAKNFSAQAFRVMLESQAGEHGARMSAMENATKNAGDMIKSLSLQYNKQRQASITKELLEIISGSESQKS
ncbi:ATP synthase F1 subunit gamma [Bdellovibrionota bacterium FG-1]